MNRWLLPVTAALGLMVGAGAVFAVDRTTPAAERARTEGIVHDYLLAHPEILPQAMQTLQDRETGKQVSALGPAVTTPVGSAWAGNPRADVTLVEYFDYNCGYCRASLPIIAKLVASDPKLRVVYRELPVLSAQSHVAALASLAAARQGKFAAFHDALYAAGPVSDATIAAAAAKAGVTVPATPAPADEAEINRNLKTAGALGMTGTPSWVIGNRVLSGALPLETLQAAVAAARAG